MSCLKYKTRNMSTPQGKPRVYFCCHPEDFSAYFESVSNEILAAHTCAIWYPEDAHTLRDTDYLSDLKNMQLFVMPVTKRLLTTENPALCEEFAFAMKNHIPVLPLMQESGLEELFNQKCGELQFLDRFNYDETAIRYEEKLEKFLSTVLIGDEMAQKIRDAFDAYVFLSYRKKDRKYAQELMRLIHKNDFCRDFAIWYDEFLTPGENFNDSIKEALLKSDLFLLTVTPNLVNELNYIQETEYPMALETGKPIIPIEFVSTNKGTLSEQYKGIPDCTNCYDEQALAGVLQEAALKIALAEKDNSAEHRFFIGLAYLGGVDVEVDFEKALSLITSAAMDMLTPAMDKLFEMYLNGIGVERNLEQALYWKKYKFKVLLEEFKKSPSDENAFNVYLCLENTLDYYIRVLNNRPEALKACETFEKELLPYVENSESKYVKESLGRFFLQRGGLCFDLRQMDGAERYIEKAEKVLLPLYQEATARYDACTKDSERRQAFSVAEYEQYLSLCNNITLIYELRGEICSLNGADKEGEEYLLKVLDMRQKNKGFIANGYQATLNLTMAYYNLAKFYTERKNYEKAVEYIDEGRKIADDLATDTGSLQAGELLVSLLDLLAGIHKEKGNKKAAMELYAYAVNGLLRSKQTTNLLNVTVKNVSWLAELYMEESKFDETMALLDETEKIVKNAPFAKEEHFAAVANLRRTMQTHPVYIKGWEYHYSKKIAQAREELVLERTNEKLFAVILATYRLACVYYDGEVYEQAEKTLCGCIKMADKLIRTEMGTEVIPYVYHGYVKLCQMYVYRKNDKKVKKYIKKTTKALMKYVNFKLDSVAYRLLITGLLKMSRFYLAIGDVKNANRTTGKALSFCDLLVNVFESEETLYFTAITFFELGVADGKVIDDGLVKESTAIFERLTKEYPQEDAYKERLSEIQAYAVKE